jgi:hypothetical protein
MSHHHKGCLFFQAWHKWQPRSEANQLGYRVVGSTGSYFIASNSWLDQILKIIISLNLSSFDDLCFVPVYVFLGNPKVLVEMMNTMHALQMFDNGEYMVITVDMETYSYREAFKYLWRKYSTIKLSFRY